MFDNNTQFDSGDEQSSTAQTATNTELITYDQHSELDDVEEEIEE